MSDIVLGFVLGSVLVGFALPMKGIVFTILEQRKQIEFLTNGKQKQPDETLAEKRP